ncbi:unnamed protein product [Bursaphelenchus okinawaensis]|uniref:CCR4-NOT transcription complex subunit 4 n=1 Tax=Bursaphelenchus okinawaensis TaxID=465554 RepID=A0A811KRS9_9BILA|nr:unnamed protein product [Bursaphelenchus okinawaensis]CAG9110643.1 unnamed protein product [Bursaphelenchus okinawaensis]
MSSDESTDKECPLCMEPFDFDDVHFYPCTCQYQICRFCWHRIREDENGLCPACRQPYSDQPVTFQPLSTTDVQRIKSEKKQSKQKTKPADSRKHLANYRVLQKNLVYVVGLSNRMADVEVLKKPEYFGKYGKVLKIAVGAAVQINPNQPPSCTAYVTYEKVESALRAIEAVNNLIVEGRMLKASLGTTKYCSTFLRGSACHKPECMYLHEIADDEISFTKEDMHAGKHTDFERKLHEQLAERARMESIRKRVHKQSESDLTSQTPCTKNKSSSPPADRLDPIEPPSTSSASRLVSLADAVIETKTARKKKAKQMADAKAESSSDKSKKEATDNSTSPVRVKGSSSRKQSPESVASAEDRTDASDTQKNTPDRSISQSPAVSKPPGFEHYEPVPSSTPSDSNKENEVEEENEATSQDAPKYTTCDELERMILSEHPTAKDEGPMPSGFPASSYNFDDDLGFDPFSESSKALADLVLEEKTMPKEVPPPIHRRLPAFPNAAQTNAATQMRLEEMFATARQHQNSQQSLTGFLMDNNSLGSQGMQSQRLFDRIQNRPPGLDSEWKSSENTPPLLQSIFSAYQSNGQHSSTQSGQLGHSQSSITNTGAMGSSVANSMANSMNNNMSSRMNNMGSSMNSMSNCMGDNINSMGSNMNSIGSTINSMGNSMNTIGSGMTNTNSHQNSQNGVYNATMHEYLYKQHLMFREHAAAALMSAVANSQRQQPSSHSPTPPVDHTQMPNPLAQLYGQHSAQMAQLQKLQAYRQMNGTQSQDWREGFKAMLPNVNVRFTNEGSSTNQSMDPVTTSAQPTSSSSASAIYNGYGLGQQQQQFVAGIQSLLSHQQQQHAAAMYQQHQMLYHQHQMAMQNALPTQPSWVPPPPGFPQAATNQADH